MKGQIWSLVVLGGCLIGTVGCGEAGPGRKNSEATLSGDRSCVYTRSDSEQYAQCREDSDAWFLGQNASTSEHNTTVYNEMNSLCCQLEGERRMRGE